MSRDVAPSWDYPRNPFGTLLVVEVAEEHGVLVGVALASTGLESADLVRPELEIAAGHELTVIRNVIRRLGDEPGLGARAGVRMTIGMLGVWGFAMLASPPRAMPSMSRFGTATASSRSCSRVRGSINASSRYNSSSTSQSCQTTSPRSCSSGISPHIPQVLGPSAPMRIETTLDGARGAAVAIALAPTGFIPTAHATQ
jgi:hypothetical protein